MATTPAVHIARDRFHLAWDPAIPPIETVESGAIVEFDLLDAAGGQLHAGSTVEDLGRLDFDRVDQVNGPIAVVGAEPGDTLQIDLLDFEPADWGWTASIPGFGLLADQFTEAQVRRQPAGIDRVNGHVVIDGCTRSVSPGQQQGIANLRDWILQRSLTGFQS